MVILRRRVLILLCAGLLQAAPNRIVSTAPSITELLYALGLGDKVVGVTNYCRYPADALKKPRIGTYTDPNMEAIASLRPDLVLTQVNPVRLTERLRAMRLNTVEVNQEDLAGLFKSFATIGEATGAQASAKKLTDSVRSQLDAIRSSTTKLKKTRMMFVIGRSPGRLDGLIAVGRASYLNEVIELAGGENIFRDAVAPYPMVSLEEVIARSPEVIIDMGEMADTVGVSDQQKQAVVKLWQRMNTIAAVKNGHVYAVASDIFVVPGPRVVEAAKAFAKMLHPELP